ncbi:DoxX-like protein [Labedella gwakjiensis]|uniref:DoxX family protein n=1 Tax=Labedella gwakjiensis TaxID=390269 RepID=A0A2P8GVC6_9MICO|nr:DoxX family protein [Labedella gwakjiensis]PSL37909.1 DoxX-like protein [Labedella gwakjiensis]RUQ87991.1 DoxX family protein [Labedella gwakjiensis]
MVIAFYAIAGLAALLFLGAGGMKLARPKAALKENGMGWVDDFSSTSIKLIALAEVLGAIGLILPVVTGIAPILSPIAGIGLAVIMVGAVVVHARRSEPIVPPLVLAALAVAAAVLGFLVIG